MDAGREAGLPARTCKGKVSSVEERADLSAVALLLSVEAVGRLRLETEWLASKLASYGHSPTKKDGRDIECGHAFCRDGCAYCWLDAAEKAAGRAAEQRGKRGRFTTWR